MSMINFNIDEEIKKDSNLEAIISSFPVLPNLQSEEYIQKLGFRELTGWRERKEDDDRIFGYRDFKLIVSNQKVKNISKNTDYLVCLHFYKAR